MGWVKIELVPITIWQPWCVLQLIVAQKLTEVYYSKRYDSKVMGRHQPYPIKRMPNINVQ